MSLVGCHVWLSRPAEQAGPWADALDAAGAVVHIEPLLVIEPPADEASARCALVRAASAEIVIATSANAVASAQRLRPDWAPRGDLFAVGPASAAALGAFFGQRVGVPARQDSDGLLGLPELADVAGRRIAILAGEGGRTLLAETLAARGAAVDKLVLYRRRAAAITAERRQQLLATCHVIIITSDAAWQTLIAPMTTAERRDLGACRLVASSRRVVQHTCRDIEWQRRPVIIDTMDASGVRAAVARAWQV